MKKSKFVVLWLLAAMVLMFSSCDEKGVLSKISIKATPGMDHDPHRDKDNSWTTVTKYLDGKPTGEDTTVTVPTGGVEFWIEAIDTVYCEDTELVHESFDLAHIRDTEVETYTVDSVTFHVKTRRFVDTYNKYVKRGYIRYTDVTVRVWGKDWELPSANGVIAWIDVTQSDEGTKGKYNYTLCTSIYEVQFMGELQSHEQGFECLATLAEDKLIDGPTKTDEGFEVLSYDDNGNPATARSWIELTEVWSVSGQKTEIYETLLHCSVTAPAYDIQYVDSFDLLQVEQDIIDEGLSGTRTEGNFVISQYRVRQSVGNRAFSKDFFYSYEKPVLRLGKKTFEMPWRAYEEISDKGFTMQEMPEAEGCARRLNTHSVSARFDGKPVNAKAETECRMELEDELVSKKITDEGFDYVNPTTSTAWIEITEIWSKSDPKKYRKSVNLTNSITAPAKIVKILENFELTQVGANLGNPRLVGTRTVGDFKVETYEVEYVVGNNRFTRKFVLKYEKAVYVPMEHEMLWKAYENVSDNGFTTTDLSNLSQDGKTYLRKDYKHGMSASFNGHSASSTAPAELWVETSDELISSNITNEGFDYVNPTTSTAWLEITEIWSLSGRKTTRLSVNLTNGITAPEKITKILENFNLTQVSAQLGSETKGSSRTEGDFTITKYTRKYTVGNNKFTREFTLSYEKATYVPKNHAMIWKGYENVSDNGFTTADMSNTTSGGKTYQRKSYTHNMSASFNGHSATSKAEAELWVETSDELKSRTIIDEGFDYVNATTSKAWIKIKEVWSLSGTKEYTKSVNLTNGITAPEKITKILDNFELTQVNAQLGNETKGSSRTEGDFTITTYTRNYTVGNNKFTRTFVLKYEKAVYNPMNHNMISKAYESISDGGFTTAAMSNTTSGGKEYERKSYTHNMSAIFNAHSASSKAEAELWVEKRETPHWLGNPVSALYSRVPDPTYFLDNNQNAKFQDMVVFEYENGLVVCPNGVVKKLSNGQLDSHYIFAFDATNASKYGVKQCIHASWSNSNAQKKYSAAYYDSRTYPSPATINISNGLWSWAGRGWTKSITVQSQHANVMEIGIEVTPVPTTQAYHIDGNKITIEYCKNNNRKDRTDTSLDLR